MLSTWELFREELDRNISPNRIMIEEQLNFLHERGICDIGDISKVIKVRLMAAYEQAISEYLHSQGIYRQASLKAETIYLASTIEYLLARLLAYYIKINFITQDDINHKFPNNARNRTFAQLIDSSRCFPNFAYTLKKDIDELRTERNKVHIDAFNFDDTRLFLEEFKVVKFRKVFDDFISYIRENTNN